LRAKALDAASKPTLVSGPPKIEAPLYSVSTSFSPAPPVTNPFGSQPTSPGTTFGNVAQPQVVTGFGGKPAPAPAPQPEL